MVFLASINFAMLWFPENLIISYVPALDAYYPTLSPAFLFTNLCFGIFHTSLNTTANSRVVRRPDVSWRNKIKFVFFTGGIVLFYTAITVALFVVTFLGDFTIFLWTAVCGLLAFGFTFTGLFYANTSVFSLPIRLYLLVIFGLKGEIFYEKWFSKRESVTAALLPKAAASIASLVDNAFSQTQRMHLLSLQNRVILYEWKNGMGVMLVADQDSSVFRNSIRQLLHSLEYQQNTKQEIEARVQEVFNYYPIEYDDNK